MSSPTTPEQQHDPAARLIAVVISGAMLLLFWQLLARGPEGTLVGAIDDAPLLRLIPRTVLPSNPQPRPTPQQTDTPPGIQQQAQDTADAAGAAAPSRSVESRTTTATPQEHTGAGSVFTPSGQVKLPPGAVAAAPAGTPPGTAQAADAAKQRNVFERHNPIDYTPTRFAKDWKSDGNLAEVAGQAVGRYLDKLGGRDKRQAADPRPPPQVAFNPSLHERALDLGSEATGDAWRAAPIAFEPAPGEPGDATPRIQRLLDQLQQRSQQCMDPARDRWLAPLREQLAALKRVEHRQTHGPDPGEVALLEQQRDQTHDLARRAAWYADNRLDRCLQAP